MPNAMVRCNSGRLQWVTVASHFSQVKKVAAAPSKLGKEAEWEAGCSILNMGQIWCIDQAVHNLRVKLQVGTLAESMTGSRGKSVPAMEAFLPLGGVLTLDTLKSNGIPIQLGFE